MGFNSPPGNLKLGEQTRCPGYTVYQAILYIHTRPQAWSSPLRVSGQQHTDISPYTMSAPAHKHRTLNHRSNPKGKNVVMTSHGRAPWYTPDGKPIEAYVIGIAGGSASGKTSVARAILSALGYIPTVLILSQDAFYRAHSAEELELAFKSDLDLGEFQAQEAEA